MKNLYYTALIGSVLLVPATVFGQGFRANDTTGGKTFSSVVYGMEDFFVSLVGIILALSFLAFLWGLAIRLIKIGNAEKQKEAKLIMVWGIIGLVVALSFMGILKIGLLTAINISG